MCCEWCHIANFQSSDIDLSYVSAFPVVDYYSWCSAVSDVWMTQIDLLVSIDQLLHTYVHVGNEHGATQHTTRFNRARVGIGASNCATWLGQSSKCQIEWQGRCPLMPSGMARPRPLMPSKMARL